MSWNKVDKRRLRSKTTSCTNRLEEEKHKGDDRSGGSGGSGGSDGDGGATARRNDRRDLSLEEDGRVRCYHHHQGNYLRKKHFFIKSKYFGAKAKFSQLFLPLK